MEIKIAILIPCYNSALFLPKIFEGINAQSVPFDEIICYDDASSDNTIEVAQALGAKVIKGAENKGAAFARNELLAVTTCNWVHFHDADDLIDAKFVAEVRQVITNEQFTSPQDCILVDMLVTDSVWHNPGTIVHYDQKEINKDSIAYFLMNNGFAIIGCYPTQMLTSINGFRTSLRGNEDPDLHVRLAINQVNFKCINKPLVTNLTRPNSFSAANWLRCLADRLTCLIDYEAQLDSRYHLIIGEQAVSLSNYFYRENHFELSEKAYQLVLKTGIKTIESSKFSRLISTIFGVRFYIWLYRKRVKLKMT